MTTITPSPLELAILGTPVALLLALLGTLLFPSGKWTRRAGLFLSSSLFAALGVGLFFVDMFLGWTAYWSVIWPFLSGGFLLSALLAWRHRSYLQAAPLVPYLLVVLLLHFAEPTPRKPFVRFHAAIQPGMQQNEVFRTLERCFPQGGRFPVPECRTHDEGLTFVLDPNDGRYNAEFVTVKFHNGRVTEARYSPD